MFQPPNYGLMPDVAWATSDLCDAHGADPGFGLQILSPGLHSFGGRRWYFGQVVTLAADACTAPSLVDTLASPGGGRVLVVDARADAAHAIVGDRMGGLAVQNGWAGIILNGYVRDSEGLARLPLGVHALGTRPNRPAALAPACSGVRIEMLGAVLAPGLWVYADADGIVFMKRRHTNANRGPD